jgi:hypothetical protein
VRMAAQQQNVWDGRCFSRRDDALLQVKTLGIPDEAEIDHQAGVRSVVTGDWQWVTGKHYVLVCADIGHGIPIFRVTRH